MLYIIQPTYLPWIGYFSYLHKAKEIVFLDDVQFARRSWQQRNKIYYKDSYRYLTVPVFKKGRRDQKIKEVEIFDKEFYKKHLNVIESTYKKLPYFKSTFSKLASLNHKIKELNYLSEINILLIEAICEILKIDLKYSKSSDLDIKATRSSKLAQICKVKIYDKLIGNEGSKKYMTEDLDIFKKNKIELYFFKYQTIKYTQLTKKFITHLSILDLIFNEGPEAINIIKKGLISI